MVRDISGAVASDVVIVGAGIVGACAALALRTRGASVTLLDPGPVPHPDASSTDISKLIRLDYGDDAFYCALMETSLLTWREWNQRWAAPLFHETGILVLARWAMPRESFEGKSFELLSQRGHRLERLSAHAISARFSAWAPGQYTDGYYNPQGGWAESGRVVAALFEDCARAGVDIRQGVRIRALPTTPARVDHVELESGEHLFGGTIVIAAGAFTPLLVPDLADRLVPIGQPVFHFASPGAGFASPDFAPWAADIATTGWYGFPEHGGVVKVANHGPGQRIDPARERVVEPGRELLFREFFRESLPALTDQPLVRSRLCLYCDSFDGDFFIGRHPERAGLVVAAGGSGHAFKFAPALGDIVADAVHGVANEAEARFGFREKAGRRTEAARFSG